MHRTVLAAAALLCAGCVANVARAEPTAEESRLLAYLTRDPYVLIDRLERDADGALLVITRQGSQSRRYLIAADDPARPELRLRPLLDSSTLDTAPNPQVGGGPVGR